MTTLREHLEAIRDDDSDDDDFAYMQAIAALRLIDTAEITQVAADGPLIFCRLIRDNVTEDQWKNQWSVSE